MLATGRTPPRRSFLAAVARLQQVRPKTIADVKRYLRGRPPVSDPTLPSWAQSKAQRKPLPSIAQAANQLGHGGDPNLASWMQP
jgi:hypothetical protein